MHGFHFLHPLWLLAIPVLLALVVLFARLRGRDGAWSGIVDSGLMALLRLPAGGGGFSPWPLIAAAWTVAALALAGPSWQRQASQAYRIPALWVIALNLSPNMAATDVAPDRVTRARYAVEDLLRSARDARVALIVFAGEPYTVTPLTTDVATIRTLLDPLSPGLMPESGDQLAPALRQAGRLIGTAHGHNGQVIVLTADINDPAEALAAARQLRARGIAVSIVGIGTSLGAPEPNGSGGFLHDSQGRLIMTHLDAPLLRQIAHTGGGRYVSLARLPALIATLQGQQSGSFGSGRAQGDARVSTWRDDGVWLLPALLALCALLARRGWV